MGARGDVRGPDLTRQTMSGLVAFIVPGPDGYSKKQGEWTKAPAGLPPVERRR